MVPGGHLPRVPHRALAACRGRRLRRQDALAGAHARRPHRALAASPGRLTGLAALGRASPTWGGHGAPVVVAGYSYRITSLTVHVPPHDSWLRSLSPPQVGDASGSAGGRRFSSSVSVESGWSSVAATVMKVRARWSVTRLRSRPPQVVRVRRSWVGDRFHDACPRYEHKTIRRSAQGVPPRPARSAESREARGTRRGPGRATSRAPQTGPSRTAQGNHAGSFGPAQRLPERPDETSTRASASEPPRGTAGRDPHQGSTAHARGRRPSSSDTRSEASRITCETRAEGRPREPTAWGRGARGRFLGRPVSPESCGKVPLDRGGAFSWPHRGRLIGLDT